MKHTADIGIEDFVVSKETAEEAKISDEMKELLVKKGEDLYQ
jgi:hypothetical protein